MGKFKTEKFYFCDENERQNSDVLEFSADISISADGMFYTTLSEEVVNKFQSVGVDVGGYNKRTERKGYFEEKTFDELKAKIVTLGKEYVSKDIVSEILKIEYSIETDCVYAKDRFGFYPNGYDVKDRDADYWQSGTKPDRSMRPTVFGFQVYARPFLERVYLYRSGKKFTKQLFLPSELGELGEHGKWLQSIVRQNKPSDGTLRQIEYTEEVAFFFRSMFEAIFRINERIKGFIEPEQIKIAAQKGNLLISGKNEE